MKNAIKTLMIAILSILATIIVCNITTTTTAHAETYDIEEAYELVNKEMELYSSCYDGENFNIDYDTACKIVQLEADFYSNTNRTEETTVEQTTTTTIKAEQTTTTTTTTIKEEQTTTTTTEEQHYIECNQCKEEANNYVNKTAEIYASNYDGSDFNIDYETACKIVQLEADFYSTSHEDHEQTAEEIMISENNLNSAYDYVNQITEIYASNYDGYNFNIDYDTACDIVQLEMEFYSK